MSALDHIKAKIQPASTISYTITSRRFFGKKIVFTNGVFDLMHLGHIDYLSKAKDCGDILVVGLNGDVSVKMLNKGPLRPLQDQESRSMVLASLHFVDYVVIFEEETPYELIKLVQPDVLVKGADYKVEEIAGHDIVLARGGEVKLIELVQGYSTTAIEKKIQAMK
jgi:D-glycero-beta-D-manno-heptose 1-phosphate adenylyltransferase